MKKQIKNHSIGFITPLRSVKTSDLKRSIAILE